LYASIDPKALFIHPLAVTANARQRFEIQVARPSPDDSPVRADFDPGHWDRSRAVNAPGQSGHVDSPHYIDLAALWAEGRSIGLPFSDAAVQQRAQATLMLVPKR
jgi:acyl-homoserine lactone acylase PvdQ